MAMTTHDEVRARILQAFDITEEDLAALDPDGSYERAQRAAHDQLDAFKETLQSFHQALSDWLVAFVTEHGRYPSEPEMNAAAEAVLSSPVGVGGDRRRRIASPSPPMQGGAVGSSPDS